MADNEQLAEALVTEQPTDRRDALAEQFQAVEDNGGTLPERARDEAGKFKQEDKKAAKRPTLKLESNTTEGTPPDAPVAAEPAWKKPPQSWKKDYHEVWATADDRLKEYAFQRESEMKAGVEPLKVKAEFADQVNQVLEPFQNTIKGLGLQAPQVIKGLLEADSILRHSHPQQKLAYLIQIAQSYGVDLGQLTGVASQARPTDPNYHALMNELTGLKGQWKTWQEQQEAAVNQELNGQIGEFAQEHEHFEAVRPVMAALLQSGQAATLDEAYKKAVRLDDLLFESEIQARQAQTVSEKDKAAKSARAAAVSVKGSTPGSHTATKAKSRRDLIAEGLQAGDARL